MDGGGALLWRVVWVGGDVEECGLVLWWWDGVRVSGGGGVCGIAGDGMGLIRH